MKNSLNYLGVVLLYITLVSSNCSPKPVIISQDTLNAEMELNGKTIAKIPPSDVWPPRYIFQDDPLKDIPKFQKHYPLNVASSVEKTVDGYPVRLVELRGWLLTVDQAANPDNEGEWKDWHYDMELDPEWLDSLKIDFNQIFKVGNLYISGVEHVRVGALTIHVELNGWDLDIKPKDRYHCDNRPLNPLFHDTWPLGWETFNAASNASHVYWPYSPRQPLHWQDSLDSGQYVRMYGSLITDEPHTNKTDDVHGNFIKNLWGKLLNPMDPAHNARWSEMHSPDIISVLKNKQKKENVTAVAICADIEHPTQTLNIFLKPAETKPSLSSHIKVEEFVGPESDLGTITQGRIAPTGSNTTFAGANMVVMGDSANVSIVVSYSFPRTGFFKAIYRVKWVN